MERSSILLILCLAVSSLLPKLTLAKEYSDEEWSNRVEKYFWMVATLILLDAAVYLASLIVAISTCCRKVRALGRCSFATELLLECPVTQASAKLRGAFWSLCWHGNLQACFA